LDNETILRVSSLAGWTDCERRSAARLFRREIQAAGFRLRSTPRGIAAAIGSSVHAGAAAELGEKATSGTLPPATVSTDAAVELLHETLRQGEIAFEGPRGHTHNARDAEQQVVKMATAYHQTIAPLVQPVRVEIRLEAEIAPGLILSGQPDVVAYEPNAVRDLKTGARPPASVAPQIGGYSLLNRSHGLSIEQGHIDFVQRVSTTKAQPRPTTQAVELQYAETAAVSIIKRIAAGIRTFREGDPANGVRPGDVWSFTANPSSSLCAAKYCPAYGQRGDRSFCNEWHEKEGRNGTDQ